MAGKRQIHRLIQSGASEDVAAAGEFIHIKSSTGDLIVEIDSGGGHVVMTDGDKQRTDKPFKGFHVKNETASAITAIFVVGFGDYTPGQLVGTVTINPPSTNTSVPDVTLVAAAAAAIVSAYAATKRSTLIRNRDTNGKTLRVGGSTTAATTGLELFPGEQMTVDSSGAVYVYNPAVGNEEVSIMEIHD